MSSGHYLASQAGFRILELGGNATDAGVAAGIAINVVLPGSTSFGGVAPILIYDTGQNRVVSISGLGRWPKEASIEHFVQGRGGRMVAGVECVVIPAAADAWMTALIEHGTMSFEAVVTPAVELARDGFIVTISLARPLSDLAEQLAEWPSTAAVYSRDGQAAREGRTTGSDRPGADARAADRGGARPRRVRPRASDHRSAAVLLRGADRGEDRGVRARGRRVSVDGRHGRV